MIEKIDLERERILTVEDIILNINTFQKYISCEDLKSLYVSGVPNRFRSLYWQNFLHVNTILAEDQRNHDRCRGAVETMSDAYDFYLKQSRGESTLVSIYLEQIKGVLGETMTNQLRQILQAFGAFLKINRILDISSEDHVRFVLFKFVERLFISLHPNFMSSSNNSNSLESEIFWISITLYNLHFKQIIQVQDAQSLESLKMKLARGVLVYEKLLNPKSLMVIQQNSMAESVEALWIQINVNFFYLTFQSSAFTRILDICIFEFGINMLDGFETAFAVCFATLLDMIDLQHIENSEQLQDACFIEGLLISPSFFLKVRQNISIIAKGFDESLLPKKIQTLKFETLIALIYPNILEDYRHSERVKNDAFHLMHDTNEELNRNQSAVPGNFNTFIPSQLYQEFPQSKIIPPQEMSTSSKMIIQPKSKVMSASSVYTLNRRDFKAEEEEEVMEDKKLVEKKYLQNYKSFNPQAFN